MALVEHATITDPNIHEPKGVASASANEVYLSDGAGSGAWESIETLVETYTPAQSTPVDPFTEKLVHVRGENTSENISASTSTWTTRTLNVTKTNEASATLSSNRISLSSGTYFIDAVVTAYVEIPENSSGGLYKSKLYNVTNSSDLVLGSIQTWNSTITDNSAPLAVTSHIRGRFTLGATSNLEIRSINTDTASTCTGSGVTISSNIASSVNVVTDVCIWKIT